MLRPNAQLNFLVSLVLVLFLGAPGVFAASAAHKPNTFDVFASLDRELTVLDQQLQAARSALDGAGSSEATPSRVWADAAQKMQPTVAAILRDSSRLEQTYTARERRLHRPLFRRLYRKAKVLRADVQVLSEARSGRWARMAQARLSTALVGYAFDFQLVSGGYAALRCQAEQMACCEPVHKDPGGPVSCKWACSTRPASCRSGFPGPQIGAGFEQPLSASR